MGTRRPIQGSRRQPRQHASGLLGAAAYFASCVALCVACLSGAERQEKPTVSRLDQANANALMSCAEEPSSSNEPLWCANPDSPHCTRGTPAPQGGEPWAGPMFAACEAPPHLPLAMELDGSAARNAGELL